MEVDELSKKDGIRFYARFLPIVDAQLGKNEYLSGEAFSLADITLLAMLDPSEASGLDISPYKNVVKWRNALKQKSFYTKSFTTFDDVLTGFMSGAGK
ncbi:MAG: glutathione binding-like protein [Bacteroidetes bacterium]|nr:glutathione binding-like protein [Bacteroidota bacterium]